MNTVGYGIEHDTASGDRVMIKTQPNNNEYKVVMCECTGTERKVSAFAAFDLCAVCGREKGKGVDQCNFMVRDLS